MNHFIECLFKNSRHSKPNLWYYLITIKLTHQYSECFIFFIQTAQSRLKNVGREKLGSEFLLILMLVLKLVNYSCSQKPISDDYLDQVDES